MALSLLPLSLKTEPMKSVCALSFPDLDGKFGYYGYMSEDSRVHKWCHDLFTHYWDKAEERKDYHWFRK